MDNNSQKDELQVEQYDAAAAEAKRKKMLKRVGIGVGVATAAVVLGYFGLANRQDAEDNRYRHIVGGGGAWFESEVIHLED